MRRRMMKLVKNSGSDNSDIHMHLSDQIKVCTLKCSQFSRSISIDEIVYDLVQYKLVDDYLQPSNKKGKKV